MSESNMADAMLCLHIGKAIIYEAGGGVTFLLTHDNEVPQPLKGVVPAEFEVRQGAHVAWMDPGEYPYPSVKARLEREFRDFLDRSVMHAHSAAFDGTLSMSMRARLITNMLEPALDSESFRERLRDALLTKTDRKPSRLALEGLPLEGWYGKILRSIDWYRPEEVETGANASVENST